jgi:hypothetical protein
MLQFKSSRQLLHYLKENSPDTKLCTGFNSALVGVTEAFGGLVAVYDKEKILNKLEINMSREDAEEYFDYNIVGAYVGSLTPVYLVGMKKDKNV